MFALFSPGLVAMVFMFILGLSRPFPRGHVPFQMARNALNTINSDITSDLANSPDWRFSFALVGRSHSLLELTVPLLPGGLILAHTGL